MKQLLAKFGMVLVCCLVWRVSGHAPYNHPKYCFQHSDCSTGQSCVEQTSTSTSCWTYGRFRCRKMCIAGLGARCTAGIPCDDKNAVCDPVSQLCVCQLGYFDNNGADHLGGTCEAALGSACDLDVPCSDINAFCNGNPGMCVCRPGYVDTNGAVTAGGSCYPLLGASCSADVPCSDCNAVCDCVTQTCVCGDGYSDSNGPLIAGGGCVAASCKTIYQNSAVPPASGENIIYSSTGQAVVAFCDFYHNRGYTYISKASLANLQDFSDLYTPSDESSVLIKILFANGEQQFVGLEQLSAYKDVYPMSLQLSANVGYNQPVNMPALTPSIYVGFLPIEFASIKSLTKPAVQGYRAGGIDWTFPNCDQNPNSYLVLLANAAGLLEDPKYLGGASPLMLQWQNEAQLLPASRHMLPKFYYQYEMHMGGCGGYMSSSNVPEVDGIALGFEFEIDPDCCLEQCNVIDCVVAIPP